MGTRRETRYHFVGELTIRAERPSASPQAVDSLPAVELLDISRSGAKIVLGDCVRIGEPLHLHFEDLQAVVPGKVCWSRPEQEHRWWVACQFEPPLTAEMLEQFLQAGYFERRHDARESIVIPALARWQTPETLRVELRDFSVGGLCFTASRMAERGQRILLFLGDADDARTSAMVETQWCIEFDDGYLIGCSFLHREGLSAVRRIAARHSHQNTPTARSRGLRAKLSRIKSLWQSFAEWADRER